jgi:hypothetical protein
LRGAAGDCLRRTLWKRFGSESAVAASRTPMVELRSPEPELVAGSFLLGGKLAGGRELVQSVDAQAEVVGRLLRVKPAVPLLPVFETLEHTRGDALCQCVENVFPRARSKGRPSGPQTAMSGRSIGILAGTGIGASTLARPFPQRAGRSRSVGERDQRVVRARRPGLALPPPTKPGARCASAETVAGRPDRACWVADQDACLDADAAVWSGTRGLARVASAAVAAALGRSA